VDNDQRYEAAASKDTRFDGVFFTAVTSTGIYCRPSCPAITPKRANMRFYPTAAAAQEAGFRACKRCRPDASPGSPEWNVRADLAGRARCRRPSPVASSPDVESRGGSRIIAMVNYPRGLTALPPHALRRVRGHSDGTAPYPAPLPALNDGASAPGGF
jgi:methylphosphotriester-DNA--protein-cysteine methyltransferase